MFRGIRFKIVVLGATVIIIAVSLVFALAALVEMAMLGGSRNSSGIALDEYTHIVFSITQITFYAAALIPFAVGAYVVGNRSSARPYGHAIIASAIVLSYPWANVLLKPAEDFTNIMIFSAISIVATCLGSFLGARNQSSGSAI